MHTTYTSEKDDQSEMKDEYNNANNAPNNVAPSLPPLPSDSPHSSSSSSHSSIGSNSLWRPSDSESPKAEVDYQGSEIINNVDMTWLGQIDHFGEVVETEPDTGPKSDIPDVPDMSQMPIIPSTSKHG